MGSIVKTIGKAVKKVGKALKKIAPILLVAAAAYVGYGYMTGFQQGGWPQITEWGKNLMGGVSQGQTLSQAATAAGGLPDAGITTPLADTAAPVAEALPALPVNEAIQEAPTWGQEAAMTETAMSDSGLLGGETPSETGLLSQIQDTTNSRYNLLMDQFKDHASGLSPAVDNYFLGDAQAAGFGPNRPPFLPDQPSVTPDITPKVVPEVAPVATEFTNPYQFGANQYAMPSEIPGGDLLAINNPSLQGMVMNMGKKAWGFYKKMWDDNPGMAMWTTANVIKTIAALLDKSEEEESYRKRHVAGFAPGGYDELRKRHGGSLPRDKVAGIWAGEGMRTASVKPGPKPAGGFRTSAIDRKPQGLVGSKNQGALT